MMAGLCVSRMWLLVMLTGVSYSFPAKKGLDNLSGEGANPASGSSWEAPAGYAALGSSAAKPSFQSAAVKPGYVLPGVQMGSAPALTRVDALAAPLSLGYASSSAVLRQPSFLVPSPQDSWAIQPSGPLHGGTSHSSTRRFISKPEPLGLSHASPAFQSGEISYVEKTYDRGNYDSESEEQGSLVKQAPARALNRYPVSSLALGPSVGGVWFGRPRNYVILSAPALSGRRPSLFVKA